jgi:hypothetical protein
LVLRKEKKMEKEEWLRQYKARMIERGIGEPLAEQARVVVEETNPDFLQDDPIQTADDELRYWANDG